MFYSTSLSLLRSKIAELKLLDNIHNGKFSSVYAAKFVSSHAALTKGSDVALKTYHKSGMLAVLRKCVDREIRIHGQLSHPNIVKLHASFEDEEGVYLVMELHRGDLFKVLDKRGKLDEECVALNVIVTLLGALDYIHDKGIIHRDIKPENLLYNNKDWLLLADFGLSTDEAQPVSRSGTLDYMAPEILQCSSESELKEHDSASNKWLGYDNKVDVWAVGVLVYELLTGFAPFDDRSRLIKHDNILFNEPEFEPGAFSAAAESFIKAALIKDASLRPSVKQLLNHPWLTSWGKRGSSISIGTDNAVKAADALTGSDAASGQQMLKMHNNPQWLLHTSPSGTNQSSAQSMAAHETSALDKAVSLPRVNIIAKIPHGDGSSGTVPEHGSALPHLRPPISAGEVEDGLAARYSDLHVSSLTAREGSIVLELNAVMLPSADPLAEQSSVETRPESQAALPIDPVVWLDLMQVHKMLSANTTVSILVESLTSSLILNQSRSILQYDRSSDRWLEMSNPDDLQPPLQETLLFLANSQPRCLSIAFYGDRRLRIRAFIDSRLLMAFDRKAKGLMVLEAVVGGQSAPVTILAAETIESLPLTSAYIDSSSVPAVSPGGQHMPPSTREEGGMRDVFLEVDFSGWANTVVGDPTRHRLPPPWGLLKLNIWGNIESAKQQEGGNVKPDNGDGPHSLLCTEHVVLFPEIWASAAISMSDYLRTAFEEATHMQQPETSEATSYDLSQALRVSLMTDLAMVVVAALGDSCVQGASPTTGQRAPRIRRWDRSAMHGGDDEVTLLPPPPELQGTEKARVDGLLRVVKHLWRQLRVSERAQEGDPVASMLTGCAQLIVERSTLKRMEGFPEGRPEATPEVVPEPQNGTVSDAEPTIRAEVESDQGCGIPFLWATVNLMMTLTVSVYQRRMGVKNTEYLSDTPARFRLIASGALILLPYLLVFLSYLAARLPGIRSLRLRSPPWIVRAARWTLGPNAGIITHLNLLRHILMTILGMFPALSISDAIIKRNSIRWTFVLWRTIYAAFESYDPRAAAIVIFFLDVPIWAALMHFTLHLRRPFVLAATNGVVCFATHVTCSYLKQWRKRRYAASESKGIHNRGGCEILDQSPGTANMGTAAAGGSKSKRD